MSSHIFVPSVDGRQQAHIHSSISLIYLPLTTLSLSLSLNLCPCTHLRVCLDASPFSLPLESPRVSPSRGCRLGCSVGRGGRLGCRLGCRRRRTSSGKIVESGRSAASSRRQGLVPGIRGGGGLIDQDPFGTFTICFTRRYNKQPQLANEMWTLIA